MPYAKYIKPPGPFPPFERLQHSKFQFRADQWHKLTKLLPSKLADLGIPPNLAPLLPEKVKTIADCVIQATEDGINSHLTGSTVISGAQINAANVRTAIRRLRHSLIPFVRGWVDEETADMVAWAELDAALASRYQELAKVRFASTGQRALAMLCQIIADVVKQFASTNGETISEHDLLRYIDVALEFGGVQHPTMKHRDRLARLVYPTS